MIIEYKLEIFMDFNKGDRVRILSRETGSFRGERNEIEFRPYWI